MDPRGQVTRNFKAFTNCHTVNFGPIGPLGASHVWLVIQPPLPSRYTKVPFVCVHSIFNFLEASIKGGVRNICIKYKIYSYTKVILLNHHLWSSVFGDCVCRAPPSARILMFWFSRDVSGWGVGVFLPSSDNYAGEVESG